MTKLDVSKRFLDAMLTKDNYKSTSLPMVTPTHEVMFFYYVHSTDDGGFVLDEICEIFYRDLATSEVTVKSALNVFTPAELERLTSGEVSRDRTGDEVQDYTDTYYDLHEQVLDAGLTTASNDLLRKYMEMFGNNVPKSPLRTAYLRIGKELFQFWADHGGR